MVADGQRVGQQRSGFAGRRLVAHKQQLKHLYAKGRHRGPLACSEAAHSAWRASGSNN
jgi:hypothetical protein